MSTVDKWIIAWLAAQWVGGMVADVLRLRARQNDRARITQLESTVRVLDRWERIRRTEERERHLGDAEV